MSSQSVENLRIVVFRDGDRWVAQGLEFDVCTSATELGDVPRRVRKQLALQVRMDRRAGRRPFELLRPAPDRFWQLYEQARPWQESGRASWRDRLTRWLSQSPLILPRLAPG